ncbi:MAG TPA: hypothetical protein VND64_09865 [Pirellulales bacterium]|nr:hypothetical protein [Pirellulales bacterium]
MSTHCQPKDICQPKDVHEPTLEEIEATCAGIRAGWSQSVRRRRAGRKSVQTVLPMLLTTAVALDRRRRASSPGFLEDL